jgi:hypothetical protein
MVMAQLRSRLARRLAAIAASKALPPDTGVLIPTAAEDQLEAAIVPNVP